MLGIVLKTNKANTNIAKRTRLEEEEGEIKKKRIRNGNFLP